MKRQIKHIILAVTITIHLNIILAQTQWIGMPCKIGKYTGKCLPIRQCPMVLHHMRLKGIPPQICWDGNERVVCCKSIKTPPPLTCKPFKKEQLKVKKTGKKAWDKCIDILNIIHPCVDVFTPNGKNKKRLNRCSHDVAELILGGQRVKKNEFPHMALLGFENIEKNSIEWDCGGTLISESWVLTAGHCTWNRKTSTVVKHVRLGIVNKKVPLNNNNYFMVSRIEHYPSYSRIEIYNDIALLRLNKRVEYSEAIIPACLHTGNEVRDEKVIAIGWGLKERRIESDFLMKTVIQKVEYNNCNRKFRKDRRMPNGVTNEMHVCYGDKKKTNDTCQGDSGGPIQIYNTDVECTYIVVGVTSTGTRECGSDIPTLYTRVANYIDWIEDTVWP